jgi:Notch-like protein
VKGSFKCKCREEFTGTRCEVEKLMCESNPCIHGVCKNLAAGYRCICNKGFEGKWVLQPFYIE